MSKGMSNLIRMTYAANNIPSVETFTLFVGYSWRDKSCKLSDDKDCLPCDIEHFRLAEFNGKIDLVRKIRQIEDLGFTVCLDTSWIFYETGEGLNNILNITSKKFIDAKI